MRELLLILFLTSIFLMSIATRMRGYVKILASQGLVLFALSIIELGEIHIANLIWISVETIIFKSIIVPAFLFHIINRNKITREAEPFLPHFASLIITTIITTALCIGAQSLP